MSLLGKYDRGVSAWPICEEESLCTCSHFCFFWWRTIDICVTMQKRLHTEIITNAGGQLNEFPAAPGLSMGAGNWSEAESEFSSLPTFRNNSAWFMWVYVRGLRWDKWSCSAQCGATEGWADPENFKRDKRACTYSHRRTHTDTQRPKF